MLEPSVALVDCTECNMVHLPNLPIFGQLELLHAVISLTGVQNVFDLENNQRNAVNRLLKIAQHVLQCHIMHCQIVHPFLCDASSVTPYPIAKVSLRTIALVVIRRLKNEPCVMGPVVALVGLENVLCGVSLISRFLEVGDVIRCYFTRRCHACILHCE
jgi:hypothetical protein